MKALNIGLVAASVLAASAVSFYAGQRVGARSSARTGEAVAIPAVASSKISGSSSEPLKDAAPERVEREPSGPMGKSVPISPEFEALFKSDINMRTWHTKLEMQPRDAAWAAEMEETFRRYFLGHQGFSSYGVSPEVHCRTSICEVRMLAYGAGKGVNWSVLLGEPGSDSAPWPAKAIPGIVNWDERSGETAVYFNIMFRNRPDPNKDFARGFSEVP